MTVIEEKMSVDDSSFTIDSSNVMKSPMIKRKKKKRLQKRLIGAYLLICTS